MCLRDAMAHRRLSGLRIRPNGLVVVDRRFSDPGLACPYPWPAAAVAGVLFLRRFGVRDRPAKLVRCLWPVEALAAGTPHFARALMVGFGRLRLCGKCGVGDGRGLDRW